MKAVRFAVPLLVVGLFFAPGRAEACSLCTGPLDGAGGGNNVYAWAITGYLVQGAAGLAMVGTDILLASNVSDKLETRRPVAIFNIVVSSLNLLSGITYTVAGALGDTPTLTVFGGTLTGLAAFSLGWSIFKLLQAPAGQAPAAARGEGLSPWVARNKDGLAGGLMFSSVW